ncbi:hypothetical protein ASZ90_017249 [hydrocarbon metagenome]|uniref:DUF2225 domain-containing protein n=1 Tax=hydrocarbon metagenome TaxID=938273 RepID=A0A0W8E9N9_9ZZZZ
MFFIFVLAIQIIVVYNLFIRDHYPTLIKRRPILILNQSPLFERHFNCPVCGKQFTSMSVRSSAINVAEVESDKHIIYHGPSPLHYIITVCPSCLYAAPYSKFDQPLADHLGHKILAGLKNHKNLPFFGGPRDLKQSLLAFNLSIETARMKNLPASEIAGLILCMAWIARESGHDDIEQRCLNQAMECYIHAYTSETEGKLSDVQLAYIIGDIQRRTGNDQEAVVWLNQALHSKNIKAYPDIEKQARDVWATIRGKV